jgi:hypothetical protein
MEGSIGRATLGDYIVTVDVSQPGQGVQWTSATGNVCQATTLQFVPPASSQSPPKLVDAYVRGHDLVATYEQLPGAEVQPQLYWRLLAEDSMKAVGVQLLISMQTSLLQSEPKCTIESTLPQARTAIWDFVSQAWNGSQPDGTFDQKLVPTPFGRVTWFSVPKQVNSYIEVIYPDDIVAQHVTFGHSQSCFFAEHLEKGVIRRGRIAGWMVPNKSLMSEAREPLKLLEFAKREALPLTT